MKYILNHKIKKKKIKNLNQFLIKDIIFIIQRYKIVN
jgi:hypothetical protein